MAPRRESRWFAMADKGRLQAKGVNLPILNEASRFKDALP
jgi:hypothetical protein